MAEKVFLNKKTMIERSGMPICVYKMAAESKCKDKKESKEHQMDLLSQNFKTL